MQYYCDIYLNGEHIGMHSGNYKSSAEAAEDALGHISVQEHELFAETITVTVGFNTLLGWAETPYDFKF